MFWNSYIWGDPPNLYFVPSSRWCVLENPLKKTFVKTANLSFLAQVLLKIRLPYLSVEKLLFNSIHSLKRSLMAIAQVRFEFFKQIFIRVDLLTRALPYFILINYYNWTVNLSINYITLSIITLPLTNPRIY